jgi:hypothetical protein
VAFSFAVQKVKEVQRFKRFNCHHRHCEERSNPLMYFERFKGSIIVIARREAIPCTASKGARGSTIVIARNEAIH